jgi:CubicO group peptidase (beta-lactamase class C family)
MGPAAPEVARMSGFPLIALLASCATVMALQAGEYDYFEPNRELIRHGVQAVLTCNGLFTSHRTLDQVFKQELRYLPRTVGTVAGGDYVIDWKRRAVEVGGGGATPGVRAVFRDGIGCVVMAPGQSPDAMDSLPVNEQPPSNGNPENTPWPNGDLVSDRSLPAPIDAERLQAASDWAFERESTEQVTVSLVIVHEGHIIHERYADGFDRNTRTRTWSTAKSIAVTLIGMLVDDGRLELDGPLGIDWLPAVTAPEADPRRSIALRHLLNMSSGLFPVDSLGMEYATGSGMAYWAGASSVDGARSRGLIREPGSFWDYENYDTLLAVYAMKRALGDEKTYLEFPRRALLDRIGMRNTLVSTDRFGDFILSSQVYTNARDLARFGLLYLQGGIWDGVRLISEEWIEFVRTPAPASASRGSDYGGQWWLVPDDRKDVPADAYSTAGNRGQYVIVAPSHQLVIVRRGLDFGKQGFNNWDLLREVLKAFGAAPD